MVPGFQAATYHVDMLLLGLRRNTLKSQVIAKPISSHVPRACDGVMFSFLVGNCQSMLYSLLTPSSTHALFKLFILKEFKH